MKVTNIETRAEFVAAREATIEWKEFRDYFERSKGFSPTIGDSRVEELFNFYLIGAYDKSTGRHDVNRYKNAAPPSG